MAQAHELLTALEEAVAASPVARERWAALSADQRRPLQDWVCAARTRRGGLGRVREAVGVLERPPAEDVSSRVEVDPAYVGVGYLALLEGILRRD